MQNLRISEIECTANGIDVYLLSAGEFTGVFVPKAGVESGDVDLQEVRKYVADRAAHYLELPDDAELVDGEDITLAEIKESIIQNMEEVEPQNV